jgi:hypothetical protein
MHIFMTFVQNFITLNLHFLIHYHQIYQHGNHINFCGGSDLNVTALIFCVVNCFSCFIECGNNGDYIKYEFAFVWVAVQSTCKIKNEDKILTYQQNVHEIIL